MDAAGYILTGCRKIRRRAHPAVILEHSLPNDFLCIEDLDVPYPDYENFSLWPATAALLKELRALDHLAGQSSVDHFGVWQQRGGRLILCSAAEMRAARVSHPFWGSGTWLARCFPATHSR